MKSIIKIWSKLIFTLIIAVGLSNGTLADTAVLTPSPLQKVYNIEDFGAIGNGERLNTEAIQKAINAAHQNGGGRVLIPDGVFLTGSIYLKSGVDLHLSSNAILFGSTDKDDYKKSKEGWKLYALILASGQKNISITGMGIINGQGRQLALNVDSLYQVGELENPNYNHHLHRPSVGVRPLLIKFNNCNNVRVKNVTLKHSSSWLQIYADCENLVINNITVQNVAFWNSDGIDILNSKHVRITNSYINAADDGICIKSLDRDGIVEDVYIANNIVRTSASGVKFGTSGRGGFKNVRIDNITVYDTYRSAIALEQVDGGILKNFKITNIRAINTGNAIFINLGARHIKDGHIGTIKNITIKNVFVQVPYRRPDWNYDLRPLILPPFNNVVPASITGLPGHQIQNVTLENITITYPGRSTKAQAYIPIWNLDKVPENADDYPDFDMFAELPAWGFYFRHVDGLTIENLRLFVKHKEFRPALVFDDVNDLKLVGSKIYPSTNKGDKQIILQDVHNALFKNNYIKGIEGEGVYKVKNNSYITIKP